ncbi:NlpC/P60 family protein [Pediococcus siamensis]|uniref:C40 family peptidase n=1 Tax=Pediococcus siamensis TaxID=381829 RepID=UPI0039A26C7B
MSKSHSNSKKTKVVLAGVAGAAGLFVAGATQSVNADSVKVVKNDTVWGISQKYNVSIKSIETLNKINQKSHLILVGQKVEIPGTSDKQAKQTSSKEYIKVTVKSGDSLWQIAQDKGVSVAAIKRANNLNGNLILVGQELKVPVSGSEAAKTSSSAATVQYKAPSSTAQASSAVSSAVSSASVSSSSKAAVASTSASSETSSSANSVSESSSTASSTTETSTSASSVSSESSSQSSAAAPSESTSADTTAVASSSQASSAAPRSEATTSASSVSAASSSTVTSTSSSKQAVATQPSSSASSSVAKSSAKTVSTAYKASSSVSQTTKTSSVSSTKTTTSSSTSAAKSSSQTKATSASTKTTATTSNSNLTTGSVVGLAVKLANANIPYVWGGSSLSGMDCSGLVAYVYAHAAGITLPHNTVAQEAYVTTKSVSAAQPGDILFWGAKGATYHDAIYIGNNQYVAAPQPGQNVEVETISSYFAPSFAGTVK